MDYETKVWLALMFMYALGSLVAWYLTYQHFRAKEREREAVDEYKFKESMKGPGAYGDTYEYRQRKVLAEMQRYCTEYTVKDEYKEWHYKYEEPMED